MYCQQCGEKNDRDAKFCVSCGSTLNTEVVEQNTVNLSEKPNVSNEYESKDIKLISKKIYLEKGQRRLATKNGFSWTLLCFGALALIVRGIKNWEISEGKYEVGIGVALFVAAFVIPDIPQIVFNGVAMAAAFQANMLLINKAIEEGWKIVPRN